MEVEIGRGKKARRAYGFDDIAIVPSRRTRDPDDVDISWTLGPYRFELPLLAAALDGVVSPQTAGAIGKLGGLAVLNLEGIFCRYEDAETQLERIASFSPDIATREMQDIYREPVKPELIAQRIQEIKAQGVVAAASLTPQKVRTHYEVALEAGLDILVIQGTVVSAEHVSLDESRPPLNLKEFIRELAPTPVVVGGCASYHTGSAPDAHRALPACSSGSARARSAPRAACSASASPRPPRSPTWRPRARSTCLRPVITSR